jgi:type I restriction-modification system DNA methylase subunit
VVETFSDPRYRLGLADVQPDFLGRAYEYLLRKFADTMINPKFRTNEGKVRGHDIVVANPMWNQPFAPDVFANDPFDRFRTSGGVTTARGDWAWLQHTLACLNDHGRAAVVLDTGAVTRGSGSKNEDKERNIRKWFVDHDLIDGVILLPDTRTVRENTLLMSGASTLKGSSGITRASRSLT